MKIIIHNKLYDISNFISEHPGGKDVFDGKNNVDLTDEYNSVGHSNSANNMLSVYYVKDIDNVIINKQEHKSTLLGVIYLSIIISYLSYTYFIS